METVVKQEEKEVKIISPYPSSLYLDKEITFTIKGLIPEKSIEDRDVFISIQVTNILKKESMCNNFWLRGEKAIELGQALIQEGLFALNTNRIQFQALNRVQKLKKFINEDRILKIKVKEIDSNPANCGNNFSVFNIKPIWKTGQKPEFEEDFNFDYVLHYSSKQNFKKENKHIFQNIPLRITFIEN